MCQVQKGRGDKGAVDLRDFKLRIASCDIERIVILGVGNPLRGDDGFGPLVVKELEGKVKAHLLNAETSPENFTGIIKSLKPSLILILDALEFGGKPGELSFIEGDEISEGEPSTHRISLSLLSGYLERETGAEVLLIGVQPERLSFGAGMSKEVKGTALRLSRILLKALGA